MTGRCPALFDNGIGLASGAETRTPAQQHEERKIYDPRRNRNVLARSTQLEVAHLLLQSRSASDRAEASEVDGLDGEFRAPERDSGIAALACYFDSSNIHRDGQRSGERHRADYWRRGYCRCVPDMRLFVFAHKMRAMTPRSAADQLSTMTIPFNGCGP